MQTETKQRTYLTNQEKFLVQAWLLQREDVQPERVETWKNLFARIEGVDAEVAALLPAKSIKYLFKQFGQPELVLNDKRKAKSTRADISVVADAILRMPAASALSDEMLESLTRIAHR